MKVLLINNYHFKRGGADVVYFNTAELLKKHGHEVFFFSLNNPENLPDSNSEYFANGPDFRNLSLSKKILSMPTFIYNRDAYTKLSQFIEVIKPDIAHVHGYLSHLTFSIIRALKKGNIPIVHTVHDYRFLCPAYAFLDGNNNACEVCRDKFYLRCILKCCSENNLAQSAMLAMDAYFRKYFFNTINIIDHFIFVSQFSAEKHFEFESKFGTKASMLYNFAAELNNINPNSQRKNYFLFYGRFSKEKGINTLIKAAIKAKIQLKLIGTGPLYEEYKKYSTENIELVGYKTGDELWTYIKNASFIIVPSEWYENNPLTIIEAYSFGIPVIGSRIGGIPEIVEENKTGFLFNPGDYEELNNILIKAQNISLDHYNKMSMNAHTFAEKNFNPDIHYKKLLSIYKEVIENHIKNEK